MTQDALPPVLRFASLEGIPHAFSTRLGGVSGGRYASLNMGYSTGDLEENVRHNRERLFAAVGVSGEQVVVASLTHGSEVAVFSAGSDPGALLRRRSVRPGSSRLELFFRADAVVSDRPGLCFLMTFADCVPIAVLDRTRGVAGAAHAGWRGTAAGIAASLVRTMQAAFGSRPADLQAAIGPSIGPCCYRVGQDVLDVFDERRSRPVLAGNGAVALDLWATNERQLVASGVPATAIENPRLCTSCRRDTFFSHRADEGVTGRLALCIGLP